MASWTESLSDEVNRSASLLRVVNSTLRSHKSAAAEARSGFLCMPHNPWHSVSHGTSIRMIASCALIDNITTDNKGIYLIICRSLPRCRAQTSFLQRLCWRTERQVSRHVSYSRIIHKSSHISILKLGFGIKV